MFYGNHINLIKSVCPMFLRIMKSKMYLCIIEFFHHFHNILAYFFFEKTFSHTQM